MSTPIDLDKMRGLTIGRGRRQPDRRETSREWRSDDGERHKAVTDELNHTVTQHSRPNNTEDRQDVHLRPEPIRVNLEELRRGAK